MSTLSDGQLWKHSATRSGLVPTRAPSLYFIAGTVHDGASQSEYLGVEYLSAREGLISGSGRVAVA